MTILSSTTASLLVLVLMLWPWLGSLSCFAVGHCVEVDHVASGMWSRKVPFQSGMEVSYTHVDVPRESSLIKIWFEIAEDDEAVAYVHISEDVNNILWKLTISFSDSKDKTFEGENFKLGIRRRVRLGYSGGLLNVILLNEDRTAEMNRSNSGAATLERGNLTIHASIPTGGSYSSLVHWPCTPTAPEKPCADSTSISLYLVILALAVAVLLLLVLLYIAIRRAFKSQKVEDEITEGEEPRVENTEDEITEGEEPRVENTEGEITEGEEPRVENTEDEEHFYDYLDYNHAPPLRHRPQEGQVLLEGDPVILDTINSIYVYHP